MDRGHILSEIRRLAKENGGTAPGKQRFESETGIREHEWVRYWARWSDVLREADVKLNDWNRQMPDDELLEKLAGYTRELGRFPVVRDLHVKTRRDPTFPSESPFRRFGGQRALAVRLRDYCTSKGYEDVAALCTPAAERGGDSAVTVARPEPPLGFVYLIKSGRFHKIGRSNAVGRRERELDIALPEAVRVVHSIRTDDPAGIEDYWHRRFADRRKKGEWFALSADDVATFRRRKFM
jgi:Meiotically up-regulated gene 113